MFQPAKLFLLSLLVILIISGCVKKEDSSVKISLIKLKDKIGRVDLTATDVLSLDTLLLATTTSDSSGNAFLALSLEKPLFAQLRSGDQFVPLYLSPGDELTIGFDTTKPGDGLHFTGSSASTQQFLENIRKTIGKWEDLEGKQISDIKPEEIVARRDSLQKELNYLLQNLANDENVKKDAIRILASKNKIAMYSFQRRFVESYYRLNPAHPDIPATLQQAVQNLPEDSAALEAHMNQYAGVLLTHMHSKIYGSVEEQVKGLNRDSLNGKWATITDEAIQKGGFPSLLKEYFRAANITNWVMDGGVTPELIRLRYDFLKSDKAALYEKRLAKSFGKWEALATGKPAPDFTGITAEGKELMLSSLKGKIVYVDIWATWCGPCRAEFPYSQKLMKEFEGNDDVVFLYVSTDEDIDSWKKMLKDKSIPAGMHINQQTKEPGSVWDKYHLSGIPRYLLINRDGTMLEAHAPRPSAANTASVIRSYLKMQ